MSDLKEQFPILSDPEWLARRESGWQLLLDNGFKKEYQKKDLEIIRIYFFEGEVIEGSPLVTKTGMWVQMYPLQSREGYDHFYSNHHYSIDDLEQFNRKNFHDCSVYGMLPEDELAYWDYHLGPEYQPTVKRKTPEGLVVLNIDATHFFYNLMASTFSFLSVKDVNYPTKFIEKLDYTFSILTYCIENKVAIDSKSEEIFNDSMYRAYHGVFGKRVTKITDEHSKNRIAVIEKVEEYSALPDQFKDIWGAIKKGPKS